MIRRRRRRPGRNRTLLLSTSGASSGYHAKAVHFDGSTWCQNDSLACADGITALAVSLWFRASPQPADFGSLFFVVDSEDEYLTVWPLTGPLDGVSPNSLEPTVYGSPNDDNFIERIIAGSPFNDGWHHMLTSADTTSGEMLVYIDDVLATPFLSDDAGVPFVMPFNGKSLWFGASFYGEGLVADVADAWIAPGVLLASGGAISQANRRKFISATGKPVDPVNFPAGGAVLFSGDATSFATNQGAGGSFVVHGSLTNAATSPSD